MTTTINIENLGDGKIHFAELIIQRSNSVIDFFDIWLGKIGALIILIIISPFILLLIVWLNNYLGKLASKLLKAKKDILSGLPEFSLIQVKELQGQILPLRKITNNLNKDFKLVNKHFLLRKIINHISTIDSNLTEIDNSLQSTYIYSAEELSIEDLKAVTDYWNNIKKSNPESYKILSSDKSGEEIVFNSKKRK